MTISVLLLVAFVLCCCFVVIALFSLALYVVGMILCVLPLWLVFKIIEVVLESVAALSRFISQRRRNH